ALGQVFRGLGHGESALWILERLPQEGFEGSGGAEPQPPPGAAHHVRRLAHGLRAAREHRVRLGQQDELRALRDRLEARAAQPVDRHGGHLDREARLEPDVAGAVDRIRRGLERVGADRVLPLAGRTAERSNACFAATAPSSIAERSLSEPPNEPKPVRTPERKTTSLWEPWVFMGEAPR